MAEVPPNPSLGGAPLPPDQLTRLIRIHRLETGTVLHRIHLRTYTGPQFNPGIKGNARFSPIKTNAGASIPTLYAGEHFVAAAMETVFHDVPFSAGLKAFDKANLLDQVYSRVSITQELQLAKLTKIALHKLGISRAQLIETEKDAYPYTRPWAAAIHAACPDVQGLYWVSRQDDTAAAYMLFGDRIHQDALTPAAPSLSLVDDANTYRDLLDLADMLGVSIVSR